MFCYLLHLFSLATAELTCFCNDTHVPKDLLVGCDDYTCTTNFYCFTREYWSNEFQAIRTEWRCHDTPHGFDDNICNRTSHNGLVATVCCNSFDFCNENLIPTLAIETQSVRPLSTTMTSLGNSNIPQDCSELLSTHMAVKIL